MIKLSISSPAFALMGDRLREILPEIIRDSLSVIAGNAKDNLSGYPFSSPTGNHVIHKRTGKGASAVQFEYPYRSPYSGRIFASANTRYADNPEEYDYLRILEFGHNGIKPRYTFSAKSSKYEKARLTIPGGNHLLINGVNGFRGVTGRYKFVTEVPPMQGKYWFRSAVQKSVPEIEQLIKEKVKECLSQS
ncbi:MAG: hypothetical protein LRZ84_14410 [Desertifilum sp.]|nr:hypothetical protein [Desertifilum sp.]